jgi:hypothetical protein
MLKKRRSVCPSHAARSTPEQQAERRTQREIESRIRELADRQTKRKDIDPTGIRSAGGHEWLRASLRIQTEAEEKGLELVRAWMAYSTQRLYEWSLENVRARLGAWRPQGTAYFTSYLTGTESIAATYDYEDTRTKLRCTEASHLLVEPDRRRNRKMSANDERR